MFQPLPLELPVEPLLLEHPQPLRLEPLPVELLLPLLHLAVEVLLQAEGLEFGVCLQFLAAFLQGQGVSVTGLLVEEKFLEHLLLLEKEIV